MPSTWHHVPAGQTFGSNPNSDTTPSMSTRSRGFSRVCDKSVTKLRLGALRRRISLACAQPGRFKVTGCAADGRGTTRLRQFSLRRSFQLFT